MSAPATSSSSLHGVNTDVASMGGRLPKSRASTPATTVAVVSGLPTPTAVDLLAAMDIQAQFLAGQVAEAQMALTLVQAQIAEKDQKLAEMQDGIAKLSQDKQVAYRDLAYPYQLF